MRKVELRMNEEYKYKIIKKLVETNGNKQRAAVKLKRSVRQIDRMIAGCQKGRFLLAKCQKDSSFWQKKF